MISLTPLTRVLVTGASGVIGRQLVKLLGEAGTQVMTLDRVPLPIEVDHIPRLHLRGDLATLDTALVKEFQPELVFHLAASFERSVESPEYWRVGWNDDVNSSHRLLDTCISVGSLQRIVFASSYLVYDPVNYMSESHVDPQPLTESSSIAPRNLCGAGKFYTERELRFLTSRIRPDISHVSARIFRVYGPHSGDVIARWVRAGLSGSTIEVYNRQNRFDFVYCRDVANGLLKLGVSDIVGEVNLGTGRPTAINEVLAALSEIGILEEDQILDRGQTEPLEASCAELSRLSGSLGWSPPTSLRKGIAGIVEDEE